MDVPRIDQYIDIHTHTNWNYPHIFSVKSLVKPGEPETFPEYQKPVTVGLHPWYIDELNYSPTLELIRQASHSPQVIGIGECGIDLKKETSLADQEKIFLEQVQIAENCNKPLIIHCVKAYHIFQPLILKTQPSVPWIFHGFSNNEQVASGLIRAGSYLSVGSDLMKSNSNIRKSIHTIPLDRLFLETDDWQQPVWKIYKEASTLLRISEIELRKQIVSNYMACFIDR